MIRYSNILKVPNDILKKKAENLEFPLNNETKELITNMRQYLIDSQTEEITEKSDLRPGVGLAAPQVGVSKKIFVIYFHGENNTLYDKVYINPKIISTSSQQVYLENGEGCLSVEETYTGVVLRNEILEVEYFDVNGKKYIEKIDGFLSIVFQHEYDHLNGILFYEKIAGKLQQDLINKAKKM